PDIPPRPQPDTERQATPARLRRSTVLVQQPVFSDPLLLPQAISSDGCNGACALRSNYNHLGDSCNSSTDQRLEISEIAVESSFNAFVQHGHCIMRMQGLQVSTGDLEVCDPFIT